METSRVLSETPEGNILSFDPEKKIKALEDQIGRLEEANRDLKEIVIIQNCYGTALRVIAQLYFSSDDFARRCASLDGNLATEDIARRHWWRNGGPGAFYRDFPTPEDVIHFFRMSHSVRTRIQNLTHRG
ncbi:MAG: hypothetical protein Q7R72_00735 [bacterium]|nr:hypothetical protein [bacterium]